MPSPAGAKSLYREIFEHLTRDISGGRYKPGQKLPSEAAMMKRFRASRITIRHALRELQQQGLTDAVAGSGTYVRNVPRHSARGLLFGLVIPNLGETEIFEPICQGIAVSRDARGHGLLWPNASTTEPMALCEQCIERAVSGVFFAPLELSPESDDINKAILRRFADAQIPVVLLDRRPAEMPGRIRCDLVGIDNHRAGYVATSHLIQLGARRIGFLAYSHQASTVKGRIAGYKDAIGTAGVEVEQRVFHASVNMPLRLPEAAQHCDAFVCANDRLAGLLMHSLLAQGVRIPEDVRIVGMDDVNYASLLPVPLTAVRQPCREIGEAALWVMLERLERPKMVARDVLLDSTLVIRQSCGVSITISK